MMQHKFWLALLSASFGAAQSNNSTISLFLDILDYGITTKATGYVVTADPTATTYALNCGDRFFCGTSTDWARITAAPELQEYNQEHDGTTVQETCTFTGSTVATCFQTMITISGSRTWIEQSNITYVPTPPATRGQDNIFKWPGFEKVLITPATLNSEGATTATATATDSLTTATSTHSGSAASISPSATATGNTTNDAASCGGTVRLVYGIAALAAFAIGA